MLIFVALVGAAWAARGLVQVRHRVLPTVRWVWVPVVAAVLQVATGLGPTRDVLGGAQFGVITLSYGLIGAWLIVNAWCQPSSLRIPAGLIAGGWALNVIPIMANRGMPVSSAALARIGARHPTPGTGNLGKHILATSHTILPWLGDVVAVPIPFVRNVISVGDIVIVIGVMVAMQFVDLGPWTARHHETPELVVGGPIPS